jgi:hypothetical protein
VSVGSDVASAVLIDCSGHRARFKVHGWPRVARAARFAFHFAALRVIKRVELERRWKLCTEVSAFLVTSLMPARSSYRSGDELFLADVGEYVKMTDARDDEYLFSINSLHIQ